MIAVFAWLTFVLAGIGSFSGLMSARLSGNWWEYAAMQGWIITAVAWTINKAFL